MKDFDINRRITAQPTSTLFQELERVHNAFMFAAAMYDPASKDDGEDHADEVNGNNPDYLALKDGEQWFDEHNQEYRSE